MEISTSFSAARHQSESLFSLAIPPLLKADLNDHSARAFCYPSSATPFDCCLSPPLLRNGLHQGVIDRSSFSSPLRSSAFLTSTPAVGGTTSSFVKDFSVAYPSRAQEASLVRRELRLRQEMDHYRVEELVNEKRYQLEQERKEEREARERLIASARQVEEDRAKRLDEQQERLLQKEREFEDYKAQKAREVEAARERREAAEEKRREVLFQLELERIKGENERRVAEEEKEKTQLHILTQQVSELEEGLREKFQKELEEKDRQSRDALQQQALEWEKRLCSSEVQRETALANLQLQREQDRDQLVHSEREISAAKEEVRELRNEIQRMRKNLASVRDQGEEGDPDGNGGGVWGPSLASQHRRSIQQLQEVFEEDKRRSRRQFTEEVERLKVEMDRRVDELRDQHRAQLRGKEEELGSTQRQLGECQRCLDEEKAKLTMRLHTGDAYFVQEEARLKEEVRTCRFKNQELEERLSKAQRRQQDYERQVDQQSQTIKTLQEEIQQRWKKGVEEMDALREENHRLGHALQTEKEDRQAEKESLQSRLLTGEAYHERLRSLDDLEEKLRSVSTAKEGQEKRWEREREEFQKKLRNTAEALESCKQREVELEREVTGWKHRNMQSERHQTADLERSKREIDEKTMKIEQVESQLRESTMRLDRAKKELQAERDERERQRTTTAQLQSGEKQQLLSELEERKREIDTLRESNTNLTISQEAESHRLMRVVREKEGEVSIRQQEVEDLQREKALQQRRLEDLQRQQQHTTAQLQRSLQEKEESMQSLQRRLAELTEEKVQMERAQRRAEEERQFANVGASTQQQLLKEKDDLVARLETEGRRLKEEFHAQQCTVDELRTRLVNANDTIHRLSIGTTPNHNATPAVAPPSTTFQEHKSTAILPISGNAAQELPSSTPPLVSTLPRPLTVSEGRSPSTYYPNGGSSTVAGEGKLSSPNLPWSSTPSSASWNAPSTGGGGGSFPYPAVSSLVNGEGNAFQDHPTPTPSTWVPPIMDLPKSTPLVSASSVVVGGGGGGGTTSSLTTPGHRSASPVAAPVPSFLVPTALASPSCPPRTRPTSSRSTGSSGRAHASLPPTSTTHATVAESEKAPPDASLLTPSSRPTLIIPPPPVPVFLSSPAGGNPPGSNRISIQEERKEGPPLPPSVSLGPPVSVSPPSERVGSPLHGPVESPRIPHYSGTPGMRDIIVPSPVPAPPSPFSGFVTKADQTVQSGYSLSSQSLQETPPPVHSSAVSPTFMGAIAAPPPPLPLSTNVMPSFSSPSAAPFSGGPPVVPPPPPIAVPSFVASVPVAHPSSVPPGSLPLKEEKKKHHHRH